MGSQRFDQGCVGWEDGFGRGVDEFIDDAVDRGHSGRGFNEAVDKIAEECEADAVSLPIGHVGQHDRRVNRVVEDRAFTDGVAHHPAAIEAYDDIAAAFCLVDICDGPLVTGGCLPVDVAKIVIRHIVSELIELAPGSEHALTVQSAEA